MTVTSEVLVMAELVGKVQVKRISFEPRLVLEDSQRGAFENGLL